MEATRRVSPWRTWRSIWARAGSVGSVLVADGVGERLVDVPDRDDLPVGVLLDAADPHVPDNLSAMSRP